MTSVRALQNAEIPGYLDALASLRVRVFREYPYCYEGSDDYEREYLGGYAASNDSIVVVAEDGQRVVGASTGLPLADADPAFQRAFVAAGIDVADVLYFGESVLLADYRGRGIGHRFFDERERHARWLGHPLTAFCAVDRAPDDPRKPPGYRPLDEFWKGRGYRRRDDLYAEFDWLEIGDAHESTHRLTFWLRGPDQAQGTIRPGTGPPADSYHR